MSQPKPDLYSNETKLTVGLVASFLETFGPSVLPPTQVDNWLALPVLDREGKVMVQVSGHGRPNTLARQADKADALQHLVELYPFTEIKVQRCPDCLLGKPCRPWDFLQLCRKLRRRLSRHLDPHEHMEVECMLGYRPVDAHGFWFTLHTDVELTQELLELPDKMVKDLLKVTDQFTIKGRWCPHCRIGVTHDEKAFGA